MAVVARFGPAGSEAVDDLDGEAALVDRARHDRQAFAPLYRRYADPVYRYCYRCLGSKEAAEDAAAQIFTQAIAALPRYRDGSFRSWLFTIAHNVIVSTRRANRFHWSLADIVLWPSSEPSPEDLAIDGAEREALRAMLNRLSTDQRELLELRLAGLNDAEIARVVGRSHGAVRIAQHRAIVRLREMLGLDRSEGSNG
jgi:RNA polymerase sigma-70 factor, ECF subfamily